MASTRLTRTNTGTITNNKKFTISFWMKRSVISAAQETVFGSYPSGTSNDYIYFNSGDQLGFFGSISGSQSAYLLTTRVFRDVSAWCHIVIAVDTTQGTAADRVKIYVNGTQETAFDQSSYPAPNVEFRLAKASNVQEIGAINNGNHFDGLLTHFHFIDGTQYAATDFGETDSTSGIWKPKTSPSVTYGSNGFFLKFANSASLGLDSSGNTNNFTVSGTGTQTQDTPSNNFATLNPLDNPYPGQKATFSNGATTGAGTETGYLAGASSIGVSSGKWYAEFKLTAGTSSLQVMGAVISPVGDMGTQAPHDYTKFYGVRGNGTKYQPGGSGTNSWTGTWTTNDIIGLALDCDNNRLYVSKNGQYADGAGAYNQAFTGSPAYLTLASDETYHLMGGSISTGSGASLTMQANFGNGYFGTTALASSNSDGNGHGLFEYSVPPGYYALCTKNIKLYGG